VQSDTFAKVCAAVAAGQVHVSEHAYDEAVDDGLSVVDLLDATPSGEVIEDYPTDPRGASCLALIAVGNDRPVHAVWAFDEGAGRAILITVYQPDPARWSDDFRIRRRRT
jgi:hypothetical protein